MNTYTIEHRHLHTYNNDPQRRCYNGCNASEASEWGRWNVLEPVIAAKDVENRLSFWRDLNEFAVSQRGNGAKKEFRAVEVAQ